MKKLTRITLNLLYWLSKVGLLCLLIGPLVCLVGSTAYLMFHYNYWCIPPLCLIPVWGYLALVKYEDEVHAILTGW